MDVARINDADYINFLGPGIFQKRYLKWKERMIGTVDSIVRDLGKSPLEDVRQVYNLTDNDIGMLVRLNFVDKEFAEKTGMAAIERTLPRC